MESFGGPATTTITVGCEGQRALCLQEVVGLVAEGALGRRKICQGLPDCLEGSAVVLESGLILPLDKWGDRALLPLVLRPLTPLCPSSCGSRLTSPLAALDRGCTDQPTTAPARG